MQYQIDFLACGEKTCGEAIAIRFGDLESGDLSKQTVVLIDGGFTGDSEMIAEHIKAHYETDTVDLVVSTHPDKDHISGLPGVIERLDVKRLWMHLPWEHSVDLLASRQEEFDDTVDNSLQKGLKSSNDLALTADSVGLVPTEPFSGQQFFSPYGNLTVLGPTQELYEELLEQIIGLDSTTKSQSFGLEAAIQRIVNAAKSVFESHHVETLTDKGSTSPSNDSSVILLLELADGKKFLFNGDAGIQSLEQAHGVYELLGHSAGELKLVQVPHHGSRRNVGPTILNKFLGDKTSHPDIKVGVAAVSVGKECNVHGHPKKIVTNAFKRRGYPVFQTRGSGVKFGHARFGWSAITALPLYEAVEADE